MEGTDSQGIIVLRQIDIEEIAEKIVEDMRAIDLDTNYKVNACKSRIKRIINFYKKDSMDETESIESIPDLTAIHLSTSRSIEANVTGLYEKAKLDTSVIGLMDKLAAKETYQAIKKSVVDENIATLRMQAEQEARKINDCTKAFEEAARASIRGQLKDRQESYDLVTDDHPFVETLMLFEESDAHAKKMVETAKCNVRDNLNNLLTNPTGKKTEEEIESEQFLAEALAQIKTRLKGDFEDQKGVVDRNVDDIKSKVECMFCSKDEDEKE